MLRKPAQWLNEPEFEGIEILDPDGWDRSNFATSWNECITKAEFEKRLMLSTCQFTEMALRRVLRRVGNTGRGN